MKAIKQSVEILNHNEEIAQRNKDLIELAGRTCYKSEMNRKTQFAFLQRLVASGHESVIEHANVSFLIITNRGVSHEFVRHRIASYSQESTRYCNYSKDKFSNSLTFILPQYIEDELKFVTNDLSEYEDYANEDLIGLATSYVASENKVASSAALKYLSWVNSMINVEEEYLTLIEETVIPEWARGILPNDLKTEFVVTMNLREWKHFIQLRAAKEAHPQIREIAKMINKELEKYYPEIFTTIV